MRDACELHGATMRTTDGDSMPGRARARRGDRALVRRDPRGAPGRRTDPLRGRAGRRGGARSQAPAAGPRRLGHGDPRGAVEAAVERERLRARPSSGDVQVAADLADDDRAAAGASRARGAVDRPQGRRWSSPGSPRSRPRSTEGRWWRSSRPRDAGADGASKLAPALRRRLGARRPNGRNRRHVHLARNWIWHWGGQM